MQLIICSNPLARIVSIKPFPNGNKQKDPRLQKNNWPLYLNLFRVVRGEQHRVVVKLSGKIRIIPIEDIHYLEAADDYVKVHTREGAFLKNKTMGHFEKVLNKNQFVRTHRSFMVNITEITRIDPYEKDNHLAILKSGARVPVSKSGYVKLKSVLGL